MVWTKVQTKGDIPQGRYYHSGLLYNNNTLLVVGGNGEVLDHYLSDSFLLNLSTFEWKRLSLPIPATCGHMSGIIVNRTPKMVICAGLLRYQSNECFVVPLGPKSLVELCFNCICNNYDTSMHHIENVPTEIKTNLGKFWMSYYSHRQISKQVCNQTIVLELLLQ